MQPPHNDIIGIIFPGKFCGVIMMIEKITDARIRFVYIGGPNSNDGIAHFFQLRFKHWPYPGGPFEFGLSRGNNRQIFQFKIQNGDSDFFVRLKV